MEEDGGAGAGADAGVGAFPGYADCGEGEGVGGGEGEGERESSGAAPAAKSVQERGGSGVEGCDEKGGEERWRGGAHEGVAYPVAFGGAGTGGWRGVEVHGVVVDAGCGFGGCLEGFDDGLGGV
ncbi:hypothetical protein V493_01481, partial [Pseudogymnoascus sp. VKM F-4281 (FW-2241)]